MGGPLLLGNDPRAMPNETLELIKNKTLLDIHQDTYEAARIIINEKDLLVFRKRLQNGKTALLFVNLKNDSAIKRTFPFLN